MKLLIQAGLSIYLFIISVSALFSQSTLLFQSWTGVQGDKINLFTESSETLVLIFLAPECPLCISYAPKLKDFHSSYAQNGKIRFVGVFPGKKYSLPEIEKYLAENPLSFPCILDPDKRLTQELKASITPECVVLDKKGKKLYQGRIDNWAYALGKKRRVITAHDLKEVLEKRSKGEALLFRKTEAVGCVIE